MERTESKAVEDRLHLKGYWRHILVFCGASLLAHELSCMLCLGSSDAASPLRQGGGTFCALPAPGPLLYLPSLAGVGTLLRQLGRNKRGCGNELL